MKKQNKETCNKCAHCHYGLPISAHTVWCILHKKDMGIAKSCPDYKEMEI
jgi:hypothetical protein